MPGRSSCQIREARVDFGLNGKTALVLGAGGGLGSAIARTLAREGTAIALADINATASADVAAEIKAAGGRVMSLGWDIGNIELITDRIGEIETELGSVDVLINNTGGPPPTPACGQKPDLWVHSFQSMVLSVIAITDRVLPGMRERRWGRIITSTSSGVVAPIPNLGISNALRLSLVGWSKTLAREVARDGITVNVVLPGRIATDRIRFLDQQKADREGRSIDAVVAESTASIPVGRYGDPQEYAGVITFLASEHASYVTGSILRVDGGLISSI